MAGSDAINVTQPGGASIPGKYLVTGVGGDVETVTHCDSAAEAVAEAKNLIKDGKRRVKIRDSQDHIYYEKDFHKFLSE